MKSQLNAMKITIFARVFLENLADLVANPAQVILAGVPREFATAAGAAA
jgi:hypothetical protein